LLEKLLAARNLRETDDIESFLDPRYEKLHDPMQMSGMRAAVDRIKNAISQNQQITVYADYDADAVTAAAVLLRYFQHSNYKRVDFYIPDRFAEGYGVNPEAVKLLKERGTDLIITVDCGINAVESVDIANELGLDVIITDHHQLTGEIPKAAAVVNPHQPNDTYPCKDLTGVGVAFKLVQALSDNDPWIKWLLDIVAIGTVADCQSLLYENRILVKWGLFVLQKTRWIGLKKLLEAAGINAGPYDTYQIGFIIAPRINAAGRIDSADIALKLLLTDDAAEAELLADKLDELNRQRQAHTERILSEAREQVLALGDKKILLAAGEGWHRGIVGLVAGKLTEEFYRPVLVMEKTATEAVGSARSIGNFNIVEAISASSEILVKYGGHPQAAGFTLKSEHIELFHKNLLEYAEQTLTEEDLSPTLHYDAEIELKDINDSLLALLEKFAPFGQGNPRPRFKIKELRIKNIRAIGNEGKHLRLGLESENQIIGSVGFNLGF